MCWRHRFVSAFLALLTLFLALPACPQALPQSGVAGDAFGSANGGTQSYQTYGALLIVTVLGEKNKPLDRQSVVKLLNKTTQSALYQSTTDRSEAPFADLRVGPYEIEASAVGYLTAHKDYSLGGVYNTHRIEITLQRDPGAVALEEPNSPDMSPKARKATQRAVRALKAGNLKQAEKQLQDAYKQAPDSPDVNFLLGYLHFMQKDYGSAQSDLVKTVTRDPKNVQAVTLLGRVRLQRRDYTAASATLDEAVLAEPDYWVAHKLLAEAALNLHNFEKARKHADLALQKSKGAGNSARLILGEALANLGRNQEAASTLEAYLSNAPDVPEAPQVRDLISKLKTRAASSAPPETILFAPAEVSADTELRLSIKTWEPPGVDDSKPVVAEGVSCPATDVLNDSGKRVKQLVDDLAKFGAIEDLVHENVDELGHAISKESRKYNYIASVSEDKPGYLEVEEYRLEHSSPAQFPDNMASSGFAALALVFHPAMQDNFQFTCEGLGQWKGQATWLVHFRQRDDRPNRIHDFKIGGMIYSINLKGRAWITADKFQIIHMESQLVKPMPNIQLLTEHQIIDYGPVQFKKKNEELWLPNSADLYFDFRKHRYHRRHSFSHFMLFSTESEETQSGPKQAPVVPPAPQDQNR